MNCILKFFWSFFLFLILQSCHQKINQTTVVAIQPYGNFSKQRADSLSRIISQFYKVKTVLLSHQPIDERSFISVKTPRYRADSLIKFQERVRGKYDYIIGLTHKDISTTKKDKKGTIKKPVFKYQDWGIMGLAYCPGNSCIVSDFRLKSIKEKSLERMKKIVIHELGHNFGLPHCPDKKCVMTDAVESIRTIDNANLALCENCRKFVFE